MSDLLDGFSVVAEFPVAWGDMDAFSHVNNAKYFTYFESARMAYFEQTGVMSHMEMTREGPILASTQCRFKLPVTYPDTLSIGARVSKLEADRFTMEYLVVSQKKGAIAARGEGVIVYFDYNSNTKTNVPEPICNMLEELEGDELEVVEG